MKRFALAGALALGAAGLFTSPAAAQDAAAPAGAAGETPAATAAAAPPAEKEVVLRYPPSSARWKILIAGLATFAVGYGASAGMGGAWNDVPGHDWLFVPVIGPWAALGTGGCAADEESRPGEGDCEGWLALRGILFVIDGLVQIGGLGITAESIFMTTEADSPAPAKATVMPAPIVTEHGAGFGIRGTF
ncbi:MAG: hypothetical protein HOV80_29420 [Polyangiaceae bacterium]|nr:hypothetical protein [Polyangiaceae bacterium]